MTTSDAHANGTRGAARLAAVLVLIVILALAAGFIAKYVFHYYLNYNAVAFDNFWPRRGTLLVHITAGSVALLVGPWQFWTGLFGDRIPRTGGRDVSISWA